MKVDKPTDRRDGIHMMSSIVVTKYTTRPDSHDHYASNFQHATETIILFNYFYLIAIIIFWYVHSIDSISVHLGVTEERKINMNLCQDFKYIKESATRLCRSKIPLYRISLICLYTTGLMLSKNEAINAPMPNIWIHVGKFGEGISK